MFKDSFDLLRFQNKKSNLDTLKQEMFYNEDLNQRHANLAIQSSTSLASIDIFEFLKRNNQSNFKMPTNPYISQSRKLLNSNSIVQSIFPAEDLLDGAGGVRSERRHQPGAAIGGGTPAADRGGAARQSD